MSRERGGDFGGHEGAKYQIKKRTFGMGSDGGRKKKKSDEALEGQTKNRLLNKDELGIAEEMRVGLSDTLRRVSLMDENSVGLPNLSSYVNWVFEMLSSGEMSDVTKKNEHTEKVVRRSKGAGGQNNQKNAHYVVITHNFTKMVVANGDGRSMHSNKNKALKVMQQLVDAHLAEWKELITDDTLDIGGGLAESLESELSDSYLEGSVSDNKYQAFQDILRVLRNKKNKTPQ